MIFILLVLPALILADYERPEVNWAECKKEPPATESQYNCYCNEDSSTGELKQQLYQDKDKIITNCNSIGVQMKSITDDLAIFYLQHFGATDLGPEPELVLNHGTELQFGCKFNAKGPPQLLATEANIKEYTISLFEDRSRVEKSENVLCVIKVEKSFHLYKKLTKALSTMKLTKTDRTITIETSMVQNSLDLFHNPKIVKCDPYSFESSKFSDKEYIKPVMDRDRDILNCDYYGKLFKMKYEKHGQPEEKIDRIECKGDSEGGYYYFIQGKDSTTEEEMVVTAELYTFYCAADINKMCKRPRLCDENSPECPRYTPGDAEPAKYWCPGHKWMIDGEYAVLKKDLECKRDTIRNPNEAAFYTTFNSGKEEPTTQEAYCFTEYDCHNKSNLILPDCPEEMDTCGKADDSNGILRCADPTKKMRVGKDLLNITSFSCDPSNGLWKNDSYGSIGVGTKIICIGAAKVSNVTTAEGMTEGQLYAIIGGSFAVAMILMVIGFFVCLHCCTKSDVRVMKGKQEWKKLKKAEQVDHCVKLFTHVEHVTSDDKKDIIKALNMVEIMLQNETDHCLCWDAVIPFLMRFQGALFKIDHSNWHMFSRYMFLEAQKIIKKHGWHAPTPITNTNQKGCIRSVAIRLLALAIVDPFNSEAEEMIRDGFKQLGFEAAQQYPHCGVMWSVIMHSRPVKFNQNGKAFDKKEMAQFLDEILSKPMIEMPEADIIPEYGSIAVQAAFALGGSPNLEYISEKAVRILTKPNREGGAVSVSFFRGMCESLSRNPSPIMLPACKQWPILKQWPPVKPPAREVLTNMYEVAPEADWSKHAAAMTDHITYYGHHIDAMRLASRFLPNDKQIEGKLAKMKGEQRAFEEAVDGEKEAFRSWFAERTDKEELKKAPVLLVDGPVKLDDRILGDRAATVVTTQSNSKSDGSGSRSKSSSGTPVAPSPAAAVAAATQPAAPAAAAAATPAADAAAPPPPAAP